MPFVPPHSVSPESYVVRIYRRGPRPPGRIAGTVEIVGNGTERSFNGLRELEQILGVPTGLASVTQSEKGGPG